MTGGEGVSTKDEVTGREFGLSVKEMLVTAESEQKQELRTRDGEIGVSRMGGGKI